MNSSRLAGVCLTLALLPLCVQAATPQLVSLSPSSGSGPTQTFTVTASDADGAADFGSVDLLINTSFNGAGACWVAYDHFTKQATLSNDTGGWYSGGNSQCALQNVTATDSPNQTSVSFTINFNAHWTGDRNVYANAGDREGNNSGYQQMGTWTIVNAGPVPDFTISVTPMSQTTEPGQTVDYQITVTSVNGFSGDVIWNGAYNPQPPGITIIPYDSQKFAVQSFIHVPPNGSGAGIMEVRTSTSTPPTNNIAFTLDFTYQHIDHTYQVGLSVLSAAAPQISLSPTSGSGATQTFTVTAVDQGGYRAIGGVNFLMNTGLDGSHACWLYYDNQRSKLALASDDGSDWSNSMDIGSTPVSQSIQNSQCAVYGGPVTASGNGNTLTLTITLTFSSTFTGAKQTWVRAGDALGPDTGYQHLGDWMAAAGSSTPDFELTVSPPSQTVNGGGTVIYQIILTRTNGYSGNPTFTVTGIPPDSTLTPPSYESPGHAYDFYISTSQRTAPGAYTLTLTGTDGALSHATTATLIIPGAAVPTVSVSPDSGSGTSQTFTFSATGQDQDSAPVALDILINDSLSGQHACWIYSGGYAPQLASDDGGAWMSPNASGTMQNSQCTVSNIQRTTSQYGYGITVTLTFQSSFTGAKDIFLYTANAHGGDTGYQLKGTWTAQ